MKNVIDISKHQTNYNADTAKASGVNDVILRCAYATKKDICFDQFYSTAKEAGQTVGAYGFATWHYRSKNGGSIDTARAVMMEQVDAWIAICKDKLDGYFAIDQEMESGNSMGLATANNVTVMNEAIARLEAAGLTVCVYCSASWVTAYLDVKTLNAPLWVAYYYADPNDPDFEGVPDYTTKTGNYFTKMQEWASMDKLAGWQYGRIGYGAKYGVGSDNIDRNIFYKSAIQKPTHEPLSADPVMVHIGYASAGDMMTILSKFWKLAIPYVAGDGYITSTVEVSSGDQITLVALCASLGVPIEVFYGEEVVPEVDDVEPEEVVPEVEVVVPEEDLEQDGEYESTKIINRILKAIFEWITKYFNK